MRRLSKADCVRLRRQLIGNLTTEYKSDADFLRRFHPVRAHLQTSSIPGNALIVGSQGSGKSTLFRIFFSNISLDIPLDAPSEHLHVDRLSSRWKIAHPFSDLDFVQDAIDSEQRVMDFWYAMLIRTLAQEFDADRHALEPILKPRKISEILGALETIDVNPTTALDMLERRLERKNRSLFVGYDALDTLSSDWQVTLRLVRGLLSFWADYGRRWRRILPKIFLDSDMFEQHGASGSADLAKFSMNRVEISWSDFDLLAVFINRVANISEELRDYCTKARIQFQGETRHGNVFKHHRSGEGYRLMERLVGKYMDPSKKPVRDWVFMYLLTQNTPRAMLRLIEHSARMEALNSTIMPPKLIHPMALRQAIGETK